MNINQTIAVLQATQGMQTVKVRLRGTEQLYTYKARSGIREGDVVVCEARDFYAVGTVIEVDEVPDVLREDVSLRWVVQRVSFEDLREVLEEEDMVRRKIVVAEARKKLSEAIGDLGDTLVLTSLQE